MGELFERDGELSVIRDGLDAAHAGDGRCVLIEGPAGIGKSSLLGVAQHEAAGRGFRVFHAAGGELERDVPFGVVRQLFSPRLGGEPLEGRFSGAAELARPLLALDTGQDRPGAHGDTGLLEGFHGLYWLTVDLAADSPVLLTVDDAHWCDAASLQFLVYLRRRLEGVAVLLLVATRVGEPGAEQHLLSLLGGDRQAVPLRPRGLSVGAAATWLRRELGEDPDPTFAAAAHEATDGNPFLLGELASALSDANVRPTKEAAVEVAAIGPEGVRRAVLRRLSALGDGAFALARALAVLGNGAALRDAAVLADLTPAAAAPLVEALVRAQVLRDERGLSFVHPMVRSTIYLDIPVAGRPWLHARAARILEEAGADANAVAAHLLEADPTGDATVVEQLRVSARRAVEQGAMGVAATYLRRASVEPPGPRVAPAVFRELGAAELAAGRPDAAAAALATAWSEAADPVEGLSIVLMRRHALVLGDRIAEAVAVVDEAASRWDDPAIAELLEAGALGAAHLDLGVVRKVEPRLVALRRRATTTPLREPLALAVAALAGAMANEPLGATVELTRRALAALPEAHAASDYSVEGQLALALLLSEQYDVLARQSSAWLDDARRRGSLPRFISIATTHANSAYRTGALADAEAGGRDALEAAQLYGTHFWLPGAVATVLNPLVEHGRLDEADALLRDTRVEERHGQSNAHCWAVMLLPARARLRVAQGRLEEGLADLLSCGERYECPANRSPSLWSWRSDAALVLHTLGARARAEQVAAEELGLARAFGGPRAVGVALRAVGLITSGDEGLALLDEAATVLARSGAVLEHARALIDLGGALRHRGRRTDARQPLRDGLDAAVRCGADLLVERARDELSATGAHPKRERLTGPDALTPSERRVAQLAAQGRSNPEIAQALFVTRRTVETHLTHAYQKLGVSSRDDLSAAIG